MGLLVGGVLAGQSLIRAAELRAVTTEYQHYVTATQTFRDKYFALPGDMSNATQFWGAAHATPVTCYSTTGTGTQTCNGDGNGVVDGVAGGDVHELFRYWQHLANAGLIEGTFSGVNTASGCWIVVVGGTNAPNSKLNRAVWGLREPYIASGSELFDGRYNHWFQIGGNSVCDNFDSIFKPEELWNVDTKIDDGKPATGKVAARAVMMGLSSCTTTVANNSATLTADYLLSSTNMACSAVFNNAF